MARVAKELGFTTMSLYRHVASKDELLQLMWNASAQGAESLVLDGDGWRDRLRQWALIQREMMDRHPWITQMPMAAPPLAPNSLTFVERGLETLEETGLADADKIRVIGLLSSYALSEARMAHDAARAAAAAQAAAAAGNAPAFPASFEELLRQLVDEKSYPILHRLAWSAAIGDAPSGMDEAAEFQFGVECILDGVQKLIERSEGRGGSLTSATAAHGTAATRPAGWPASCAGPSPPARAARTPTGSRSGPGPAGPARWTWPASAAS